ESKGHGFAPLRLFTEGRAAMTISLWVVYLVTLGLLNTLNNWLPVAINIAGLPVQRSVLMTTLFQFGGIAGVLSLGALAALIGSLGILALLRATRMSSPASRNEVAGEGRGPIQRASAR